MTLTIEDVVTYYVLSSHPKNKAIVDVKDKKTGNLRYIKIRHRLPKFYAVSLVDPVTFEAWAETQVKSASARLKPIVLHTTESKCVANDNKNDTSVEFRESSRIGFEWVFTWEGEKYKWVRESRMSNILECKAIRKTGDICVAQYLPRILKDEYFGIFSLLGYNMLRCKLTKSRELELIILMSLMTLLDKSNDGSWKKDQVSKGLQTDVLEGYRKNDNNTTNEDSVVLPIAYEDPIPKKAQQKKYKAELLNDQKLQLLLEKDVKRSQKQIQSDQKNYKASLSADNSPTHSPLMSPLPTPSSTTSSVRLPALTRQKSASALIYDTPSTSNDFSTQNSPTESQQVANGRLTKLFSSLSHMKHNDESTIAYVDSSNVVPLDDKPDENTSYRNYAVPQPPIFKNPQHVNKQRSRAQTEQEYSEQSTQYSHQLSLPIGYKASQLTSEFGKLSIHNQSHKYESPPSVRSIRWNPEPSQPSIVSSEYAQHHQKQQQYSASHSNKSARRPHLVHNRRVSVSEYPLYHHPAQSQHYGNNYHNFRYSSEYYIHPYQQVHPFDYY